MTQLSQKQKYEIIIRKEMGETIRQIAKKMSINKNTSATFCSINY